MHLVAFFGLLYYGALRPAEAAALGKGDMALPDQGWGECSGPLMRGFTRCGSRSKRASPTRR